MFMNNSCKHSIFIVFTSTGVILVALAMLWGAISFFTGAKTDYVTTNLENYGDYRGVIDEAQKIYIDEFMPDAILDEFKVIHYSFASRTVDSYGFEIYLEFAIEDAEEFLSYVNDVTSGMEGRSFTFDASYQEYIIPHKISGISCDWLRLSDNSFTDESGRNCYYIDSAGIAKILINLEEQRIIYVVLAVHDGGGTDTGLLHTYFDRFGIDPLEYALYTKELNCS